MKKLKFLILVLTVYSCCSYNYNKKDMFFDVNEKTLINGFKKGEVLFFRSNTNNTDTIKIKNINGDFIEGNKCGMSREPSNHKFIFIEHLPIDNYTGKKYIVEDGEVSSYKKTYQCILSISKYPISKKIEYTSSFKDFYFITDSIENFFYKKINLNNTIFENVYYFKGQFNENQLTNYVVISKDKGILSYGNEKEFWLRVMG